MFSTFKNSARLIMLKQWISSPRFFVKTNYIQAHYHFIQLSNRNPQTMYNSLPFHAGLVISFYTKPRCEIKKSPGRRLT
jgi:hypothetical protein